MEIPQDYVYAKIGALFMQNSVLQQQCEAMAAILTPEQRQQLGLPPVTEMTQEQLQQALAAGEAVEAPTPINSAAPRSTSAAKQARPG